MNVKQHWFFLGLIVGWLLLAIVAPIVAFCLTGCLGLTAGDDKLRVPCSGVEKG